jgi:hypothetical protein
MPHEIVHQIQHMQQPNTHLEVNIIVTPVMSSVTPAHGKGAS